MIANAQAPIVLFGRKVYWSRQAVFLVLASGSLVFSIAFSVLQERVFRVEGFTYSGWVTFLTYVTFSLCGLLETFLLHGGARQGSLQHYAVVSLIGTAGFYLTNWATNYLAFATRIVFKNSKVLPVMALGTLVQRRVYSAAEYGAGLLLVMGIYLFTMGNKEGAPVSFNVLGVALICAALLCDALMANLEERLFFRSEAPCEQSEVILYLSAFASAYSFGVLVVTGELWPAVAHSWEHPEVVGLLSLSCLLGYASAACTLLLIKVFDATTTEIVKSLRRVLQVLASFFFFPRPLNWKYGVGGLLVCVSLTAFQRLRRPHSSSEDDKQGRLPEKQLPLIDNRVPSAGAESASSGSSSGGWGANHQPSGSDEENVFLLKPQAQQ